MNMFSALTGDIDRNAITRLNFQCPISATATPDVVPSAWRHIDEKPAPEDAPVAKIKRSYVRKTSASGNHYNLSNHME